jgi:hypothetical protein
MPNHDEELKKQMLKEYESVPTDEFVRRFIEVMTPAPLTCPSSDPITKVDLDSMGDYPNIGFRDE